MTPSPDKQEGPTRVVKYVAPKTGEPGEIISDGFFVVDLYGQRLISPTTGTWQDAYDYAGQINAALAPLLRKAELADRMVETLEAMNIWLGKAWTSDKPIHPHDHRVLAEKVQSNLADYRKITGKNND